MHSQSSTLDPELARLARRVPLCGRPKAKPLVEGAFIITRLSKREEKMRSLSMQERHARRYEAGADPVAQRDHERTARRVGVAQSGAPSFWPQLQRTSATEKGNDDAPAQLCSALWRYAAARQAP